MGFFAGKSNNQKIIAIGPSQYPHTDPTGSYFHSQWPYMTTQIFETTNFSQSSPEVYLGICRYAAWGYPTWWGNKWSYRATPIRTLNINDGVIHQNVASGRVFVLQALINGVWFTIPPRIEYAVTDFRGNISSSTSIVDSYPVWSNPGQTVYGSGQGLLRLWLSGPLSGAWVSSLRFIFIENLYASGGGLSYSPSNPSNDKELYIDRTHLNIGVDNFLYKKFFCYTDELGGGYRVGAIPVYSAGGYRSDVYEDYFNESFNDPVILSEMGVSKSSCPVGGGYWPGDNGVVYAVEQVKAMSDGAKTSPFQSSYHADNRARYMNGWGCRRFSAMSLSDYGGSLSIDNTRIVVGSTEVFGPNVQLYKALISNTSFYFEGGSRRIQDYPMGQNYYELVASTDASSAMRNGYLTGLITVPSDGLQKPPRTVTDFDGICGFRNNMAMPFRLANGEEMLLFNCSSANFRLYGTQPYQHSVSVVVRNSGGTLQVFKVTLRVRGGDNPFVGDEAVTWPRCRGLISLLG